MMDAFSLLAHVVPGFDISLKQILANSLTMELAMQTQLVMDERENERF